MNSNFQTFVGILAFYVAVSYVIFPLGFYYFVEKSIASAGNGFALGSLISIALWYSFGRKMIK